MELINEFLYIREKYQANTNRTSTKKCTCLTLLIIQSKLPLALPLLLRCRQALQAIPPPPNFLLSLIVETFWRKLNVNNITVKPYHTYNILHVITENRQKTGCFKIYVLNFLENKIFTPIDVYIFSLSNFPESFTDCEEPNSNYIVIVSAKIICTKIPIS